LKSAHAQDTEALHANSVSSPAGKTGRRFTRLVPCRWNQARRSACAAPELRGTGNRLRVTQAHTIDVACSTQLSKNSLLRRICCGAPECGVRGPTGVVNHRSPARSKELHRAITNTTEHNCPCQEVSRILFQSNASGEIATLADTS